MGPTLPERSEYNDATPPLYIYIRTVSYYDHRGTLYTQGSLRGGHVEEWRYYLRITQVKMEGTGGGGLKQRNRKLKGGED